MSLVCTTSDQKQFETWMHQYVQGDLHELPLYDPKGYFEPLLAEWQVATNEEIHAGKYLVALRDSAFSRCAFSLPRC